MTGNSPTNPALSGRQVIRSAIAGQWLILLGVATANSVVHRRSTAVTRVLEGFWAVISGPALRRNLDIVQSRAGRAYLVPKDNKTIVDLETRPIDLSD